MTTPAAGDEQAVTNKPPADSEPEMTNIENKEGAKEEKTSEPNEPMAVDEKKTPEEGKKEPVAADASTTKEKSTTEGVKPDPKDADEKSGVSSSQKKEGSSETKKDESKEKKRESSDAKNGKPSKPEPQDKSEAPGKPTTPEKTETSEAKKDEPAKPKSSEVEKKKTVISKEKESSPATEKSKGTPMEEPKESAGKELKVTKAAPQEKPETKEIDKEESKTEENGEEFDSTSPGKKRTPRKKKLTAAEKLGDYLVSPNDGNVSTKRARKSVERHAPADFLRDQEEGREVMIPEGRGTKLDDMENVHESIMNTPGDSSTLREAYKLVYGTRRRGKMPSVKPAVMRRQLLAFSGYLEKDATKEDDQAQETKYSQYAYKLLVPTLKDLCDFFDIDRFKVVGKDALIEHLLDFLGAPDPERTKAVKRGAGSRKKRKNSAGKTPPAKKRKKSSTREEVVEAEVISSPSDEEMEDAEDKGTPTSKMPTEKELRKWVRAYVSCFNLDKATTKHAIETVSDKFGVDLSEKKALIKQLLAEALS